MYEILYATGNNIKFHQGQLVCKRYNIHLLQNELDVPEIQSEDGVLIARDKAEKAFAKLQKPVIISDDSWSIPALKGFPGAYMKSMNHWLSVEDWLRLTQPLEDRRIILRQIVVFQDTDVQKVFSCNIEGVLLTEPSGKSIFPHAHIVSFDGGKHSTAEFHERNESAAQHHRSVWDDVGEWYSNNYESSASQS